ncbi:MAG TPA: helix-turn-helix transcriptional regulator [Muribaculaceae bacterium]|nr:helix-turn-helix transcriptional regulator [Muribaculaceae bacterium]
MARKECRNRLRVVMAEKQLTNIWMADKLGVTEITVSRWRTNKVQPSMAQFVEMAHVLKVDIKDLLEASFDYSDNDE